MYLINFASQVPEVDRIDAIGRGEDGFLVDLKDVNGDKPASSRSDRERTGDLEFSCQVRLGFIPVRSTNQFDVAIAGKPTADFVFQHFLAAFRIGSVGLLAALHRFQTIEAGFEGALNL